MHWGYSEHQNKENMWQKLTGMKCDFYFPHMGLIANVKRTCRYAKNFSMVPDYFSSEKGNPLQSLPKMNCTDQLSILCSKCDRVPQDWKHELMEITSWATQGETGQVPGDRHLTSFLMSQFNLCGFYKWKGHLQSTGLANHFPLHWLNLERNTPS